MSPSETTDKKNSTEKDASSKVPETPPPIVASSEMISSDSGYRPESRGRFTMLITYFALAVGIAAMIVFGGRWLYHKVKHTNSVKPVAAGNNVPSANTSTNSAQSQTSTQSSSTSSSSTSIQDSNTGTTLPNSGPGDVVAIFVGTSILVGGLHYVVGLRRG